MDEKSEIDIGLNEFVVPINEQGSCGSKDYLHSLEFSIAPHDPKFGVASHFISSCNGKMIAEIKPSISTSKKSLLAIMQR